MINYCYTDIEQRKSLGSEVDKKIIDFLAGSQVDEFIASSSLHYEIGHIMANIDNMVKRISERPIPKKDNILSIATQGMTQRYMSVLVCGLFIIKMVKDKNPNKDAIVIKQIKAYIEHYKSYYKPEFEGQGYTQRLLSVVYGISQKEQQRQKEEQAQKENEDLQKLKERQNIMEEQQNIINERVNIVDKKTQQFAEIFKYANKVTGNKDFADDDEDQKAMGLLGQKELRNIVFKGCQEGLWKTDDKNPRKFKRIEKTCTKRQFAYFVYRMNEKFSLYSKKYEYGNIVPYWRSFEILFNETKLANEKSQALLDKETNQIVWGDTKIIDELFD